MAAFHALYFQGEDQAKAAIKGCHTFSDTIKYLLFVGPYWTLVEYGPFTSIQLEIRTHKPSASSDFKESSKAIRRLNSPAVHRTLYLLGTISSAEQLESILASTDQHAAPLRAAASAFNCESIYSTTNWPTFSSNSTEFLKYLSSGGRSGRALSHVFSQILNSFAHVIVWAVYYLCHRRHR
jgi:hypothetical protein